MKTRWQPFAGTLYLVTHIERRRNPYSLYRKIGKQPIVNKYKWLSMRKGNKKHMYPPFHYRYNSLFKTVKKFSMYDKYHQKRLGNDK